MKSYLVSISLLACTFCTAQPTAPILRLETGMHAAIAGRIATDAAGKYLLTCSEDKTARLWDAATGQLLNTLRAPIGGTYEGALGACALSPDGSIATVGGLTGYEWDSTYSIYLIHTQTGNIIHRIKGLPNGILDLDFSPDGQWLAAGLGGSSGVRLYNAQSWVEVKKLEGYGGSVFDVAFDKANRLATACWDGKLRLYNSRFEIIATQSDLPGKQPISIAFNPSGTLLGVGYTDTATLDVRSGTNLNLLYKPAVTNADSEPNRIYRLSFSSDGNKLYGGGLYTKPDEKGNLNMVLRSWNNAGRGSYMDELLLKSLPMDIKPLPNGNMAISGYYPDIAVVSASGNTVWYKAAISNDYSGDDGSHLRINNTGTSIGFTPYNEKAVSFDIMGRQIKEQASIYPSYADKNGNTVVTNWGFNTPAINNKPVIFFEEYEPNYSIDISSNGKEIIFGTVRNLYKADVAGNMLWKTALPALALAVNISGNNKTVAAALADGTIRWYSMADGKELLAFYLPADKKRWVLFTPSGYYDASPGAEDLLGWHVNNGPDEAPSFYPVSRFREQYYRPDIIDVVLETYSEEAAITLANSRLPKTVPAAPISITQKLPPVLTIASPANGSTVSSETIKISYSLKTPDDAPVKTVKVLVNGRPVAVERGVKVLPSNDYTISITIPPSDCTVTLLAENENGTSPEANLYLKYKAEKPKEEFVVKPKLYLLAIGISNYKNTDYRLGFATADAVAMAAALKKQKGLLYQDVVIKLLTDSNATREAIQDGLQWIQEQTGQKDIAMLFFAGHGVNDNNGIFYMLPVGADVGRLKSTCLNKEELIQTANSIAGKVVLFIDACHSGNVMGSLARRSVPGTDINALVNELSATENGAVTFTSSTGREFSLEDPAWQHGAFTKALLEGLGGKAIVQGKGKITVKSLDAYVSERVKELTSGKQHPTTPVPPNVPDFTIAVGQ